MQGKSNSEQTRIVQIVNGMPASDGAGVKLKRVLGQPLLKRLDPFLMLDEFGSDDSQDYIAGFPKHPHRGFQTVTYMLNGKMQHKDSVGNIGVIEDGGLQWMNAGKGIIHEEMPLQTEGKMRGFQLWVNLPAEQKMSEPSYQDLASSKIPEVIFDHGKLRVLAGDYKGISGAVSTQGVYPNFFDIHFEETGLIDLPLPPEHAAFVYIYEGQVSISKKTLGKGQLGVLDVSNITRIKAQKGAKLILASGTPIGEPVEQYGPFVMNTKDEINQAVIDFQSGMFA